MGLSDRPELPRKLANLLLLLSVVLAVIVAGSALAWEQPPSCPEDLDAWCRAQGATDCMTSDKPWVQELLYVSSPKWALMSDGTVMCGWTCPWLSYGSSSHHGSAECTLIPDVPLGISDTPDPVGDCRQIAGQWMCAEWIDDGTGNMQLGVVVDDGTPFVIDDIDPVVRQIDDLLHVFGAQKGVGTGTQNILTRWPSASGTCDSDEECYEATHDACSEAGYGGSQIWTVQIVTVPANDHHAEHRLCSAKCQDTVNGQHPYAVFQCPPDSCLCEPCPCEPEGDDDNTP